MNPLFNPLLPPIVDEINPLDSLAAASCVTFGSSPIQGSGKNQRKGPLFRVGSLNSIGGSVVSGNEGVQSFTAHQESRKLFQCRPNWEENQGIWFCRAGEEKEEKNKKEGQKEEKIKKVAERYASWDIKSQKNLLIFSTEMT